MRGEEKTITRRDFLKAAAGTAWALSWTTGLEGEVKGETTAKVVLIRRQEVFNAKGEIQPDVVQEMLDEALSVFYGEKNYLLVWKRLFQEGDIVGIKSNVWWHLPTPREVERAIQRRLVEAGVAPKNIGLDDRGVLKNPIFQRATALINVRPLRTHHWSGIGGCLKNYIMFVPDPSAYHGEACADLGKIWNYPIVKGKTRLNILCAFTPQFYGRGAHFFDRRYVWPYGGLIVGTDPVAVDAVGARLLQLKRLSYFGEDKALDVPPVHIAEAEKKYKIGVSDLRRIQILKVGWMEDSLI
ncbi:MAG: DUF362 domain-containing protein [Thermodesulfobacteriota bacterium]